MSASPRYDIVALGRGHAAARSGRGTDPQRAPVPCWEGGGEYNVARGLRRCFGLRAAVVTALVDNEVGRLVEDLHAAGRCRHEPRRCGGRSTAPAARCATASTSPSAASACAARSACPTAATPPRRRCAPGDVDWHELFAVEGARWFHTGGIFAALSETTPPVIAEAIDAARAAGTTVSYDLNYRPSLWKARRRARSGARREPRARPRTSTC